MKVILTEKEYKILLAIHQIESSTSIGFHNKAHLIYAIIQLNPISIDGLVKKKLLHISPKGKKYKLQILG